MYGLVVGLLIKLINYLSKLHKMVCLSSGFMTCRIMLKKIKLFLFINDIKIVAKQIDFHM